MNSRDKGCRGEREWAAFLTEHGYQARRGQQFSGSPDSPDVVCPQLKDFHFEVKRTERLSLYKAMDQADHDSGGEQMPVVAHRKNQRDWLIILDAEDFMRILSACSTATSDPYSFPD